MTHAAAGMISMGKPHTANLQQNQETQSQSQANLVVLKVGGGTPPAALRTAIVENLRRGNLVALDTIGVAANYIATKAVILARGQLSIMGMDLNAEPTFREIEVMNPTDSPVKTGIRWLLHV